MRLIAFGCSLTAGQWMSDNSEYNPKHPRNEKRKRLPHFGYVDTTKPSQYAWPAMLGKLLKVTQVVNMGMSGASNKEIWKNILEFPVDHGYNKQTDIVVVQWTNTDRWTVFNDKSESDLRIYPTNADTADYSGAYYGHLHSKTDSCIDMCLRYDHAYNFLKSRKIKQYHFVNRPKQLKPWQDWWVQAPDFPSTTMMDFRIEHPEDLALDKQHPGPIVHSKTAGMMFQYIKESEKNIQKIQL